MNTRILIYILLAIVFISGCGSQGSAVSNSSADWAYSFVIWNDDIYEILEEEANPEEIGEEIGEVKQYSDFEGIYSNGFSNKYPEGTKLYKVNGVKTSEYIDEFVWQPRYAQGQESSNTW